jgi:hypothetical protein
MVCVGGFRNRILLFSLLFIAVFVGATAPTFVSPASLLFATNTTTTTGSAVAICKQLG